MSAPLTGRRIVLCVSGSIAAYKAADLASQLGHLGADMHVVLTASAARFVGPDTFRGITLNPVLADVFDEPHERWIAHIELAQASDLIVVAPATANLLAKMAHGIADDLASTVLLAATVPVLAAPAMNSAMLTHPATRANLALLRQRGVRIVDPVHGVLACRTEGPGKLADVTTIVEAVLGGLTTRAGYAGVRVLVTAGPTREPLDPVRFLSNRSSGRMGYAVAEAARSRGAAVTLVAGPTSLPDPPGCEVVRVERTAEMLAAVQARFGECDLLVAAAAPADYRPQSVAPEKLKKGTRRALRLVETPDILQTVAAEKADQVVVGFAAETGDLLANAREKLVKKRLDLLVANDVTAPGAGFDVETNVATLLWPDGRSQALECMPKRALADRILDAALSLIQRKRG